MKLLIYGHKGWIGTQFVSFIKKDNSIDYILGQSRVDDTEVLLKELDTITPTHVISFIGRTHGTIGEKEYTTIDYLEQPGKLVENLRDNLFSPLSLAMACKERKLHYTYIGTGCIFNYKDIDQEHFDLNDNGFNENDVPNFFGSGYSIVKGFTDRLMHQLSDTVLNLRIRMPIIEEDCPRNFITKITNYRNICSVPNSMSVLTELLPIALRMLKSGMTGTINLTNPGVISHNEILEMYKEYVEPTFTWENFSIEEQRKVIACERSNNLLDTSRLEAFAPEVRPITEAVREIMKNYNPTKKQVTKVKQAHTQPKIDFHDNETTILFVTGGAGFIGSNFINEIYKQYKRIKIINFDALYYCANEKQNIREEIRKDKNRYTFIHGNLQSLDLLNYIFQINKITHVIHFAAQSHVQTSFTDAIQYTKDNILGTHNLLEAVRLYCPTLNKFIHVSTDEVYGESMLDTDEKHKTEQTVLCPTNPYAATKAGAELIAQAYNHSFKMPIIITRGNNVYGPNQYPEKVIPRFIQQLRNGEKVTIQGDGSCVRAFLHAIDTANAFIKILEKGRVGEIYNIGCDEGMEYSILEVAKILIKNIKGTDDFEQWITFIEDRPFNDQRYYISNYKLKELGWEIKIKFEDGIVTL
uniref:NAD(P)-binding domain-containing protein n=1 Tax=viral metagenome TaxID=1070528 RepID=A0A6C0HHR4_9ZZZZ